MPRPVRWRLLASPHRLPLPPPPPSRCARLLQVAGDPTDEGFKGSWWTAEVVKVVMHEHTVSFVYIKYDEVGERG